jgi:hypothetical protein
MQRKGYRKSTIKAIKTLKAVANRCNITNPTELKTYLAAATYTQNRKHKIICDIARLYTTAIRLTPSDDGSPHVI